MKTFNIGTIEGWQPHNSDKPIIPFIGKKPRPVTVDINAATDVIVEYSDNPDMKGAVLLARDSGLFNVSCVVTGDAYIRITQDDLSMPVFVRSAARSSKVSKSKHETLMNVDFLDRKPSQLEKTEYRARLIEMENQRKLEKLRADRNAQLEREAQSLRDEIESSKEKPDDQNQNAVVDDGKVGHDA